MSGLNPQPPVEALPRQNKPQTGGISNGSIVAGQPWSIDVERVGDLVAETVRLDGTVTTPNPAATPAAIARNPYGLLGPRVELLVNGAVEFSAHPDLLLLRAQIRRGRNNPIQMTTMTTAQLGATGATVTFAGQLPFDHMLEDVIPTAPGLLFGEGISSPPNIKIQGVWGTIADLCTSAGAVVIASAGITVSRDFCFNERQGRNGARSGFDRAQAALGFGHYKVTQPVGKDIAATADESFSVEIPGGRSYTGIGLRFVAGSTPVPSDSPLAVLSGKVRLKRGSDVIFESRIDELIGETVKALPYGFDRTGLLWIDPMKAYKGGNVALLSRMLMSNNGQPLTLTVHGTTSTGAHGDVLLEEYVEPGASASARYAKNAG